MGDYTEIYVRARFLAKSTPDEVIDAIRWLMGEVDEKPTIDHQLFSKPRARCMLATGSYYHQPQPTGRLFLDGSHWYLCARSDIKNCDGEIEAFFDWIRPHVTMCYDELLGYSLFEQGAKPELYFAPGEEEER